MTSVGRKFREQVIFDCINLGELILFIHIVNEIEVEALLNLRYNSSKYFEMRAGKFMVSNYFIKCNICGKICDLKYQMGFLKRHPIRYKCSCGVSIRGEYREDEKIVFENASIITEDKTPNYVVVSSGEFLTNLPYHVDSFEDTITISPFIKAVQDMNYEEYRKTFSSIIHYRDTRRSFVRAVNELYSANNKETLISIIKEKFDRNGQFFPLNNDADILRAVTMINQFQFLSLGNDNQTQIVTNQFFTTYKKYSEEVNKLIEFLSGLVYLFECKKQLHNICDHIYEKIELLFPAISIDFYKEKASCLSGKYAITTASFEDIKQLYVDLYELICNLLIIPIGLDNIIERTNYNEMRQIQGLNISLLEEVPGMRNKGNIIKLIDNNAPFESLICTCLNSDIRNSIGHFSYESEEIADSYGQTIRFFDSKDRSKSIDMSLVEICYDIWQMYKCLGVFNELIHHIEIQILANKGIMPSFITDKNVREKVLGLEKKKKKVYPNDVCPCGSGLKYKKCCGKSR